MRGTASIPGGRFQQDELYRQAAEEFGAALERLAGAYESDADKRRDLSQDIHFQLWRSFLQFDGRCSLRTWTFRVAHNVATSHVIRQRRKLVGFVSLEELESLPGPQDTGSTADRSLNLQRLSALIQRLKPLDRQVIVSYLEDLDAASIAEISGLSPANVAVRISRIKSVLRKQFHKVPNPGGNHAE